MRMPPNAEGGGRREGAPGPSMEGGMRMPPNHIGPREVGGGVDPSMEGGMRMPPNSRLTWMSLPLMDLQWRAACACRRIMGRLCTG